jgi:hypothetical protein
MEYEIEAKNLTVGDWLDLTDAQAANDPRALIALLDQLVIIRREGVAVPLRQLPLRHLKAVVDQLAASVTNPNSESG